MRSVRVKVDEDFINFARELGFKPNDLLSLIASTFPYIPYWVKERLKSEDAKLALLEMFSLSELGYKLDKNVKDYLKLKGFFWEDADINLFNDYFFLAYAASKKVESNIFAYYLVIDKRSPRIILDISVKDEEEAKEIVERLADSLECWDLDYYYEDETLNVIIDFEEIPDIPEFDEIERIIEGELER